MCDVYERDDSQDRVPGKKALLCGTFCGPHLQASCHVKVAKQKRVCAFNKRRFLHPWNVSGFLNFIHATCNQLPRVLKIGSVLGFIAFRFFASKADCSVVLLFCLSHNSAFVGFLFSLCHPHFVLERLNHNQIIIITLPSVHTQNGIVYFLEINTKQVEENFDVFPL